ncbi:MAG: CoA transferase [Pseudomonadota bacterium]|nr:CoA transferase [Pseudomonadota bacterium]
MSGPLTGIRILDLTNVISGPFATMILADQGADVVKVELPGVGDFVRSTGNKQGGMSATFLNNNRNKRSITVDLKDQRGKDVLLKLVESCDAMVQNFRPGVVERIGISYDDVKKVKPDIVYLSISGFGEKGPYSQKPTYDPIVQALSGLTTVQAGSDQERPRLIRTIVPDKVTALTASQAMTAGLLSKFRTGEGQHIRLSMLDSVIAFMWSSDMGGQTYVGKQISAQRAASFIDLIYETKDGYMSVSTMTNAQWAGLSRATENPEWLDDERFQSAELRDLNINDRLELVQGALIQKTTQVWLELLEANNVPCAPVLTRNALIEHPQIRDSGILVESDHPQAGRLRQARTAARFEGTPAGIRHGAPQLGENTDDVLLDAGLSDHEIAALRESGIVGG